ncbi:MAG: DUF2145 domain-containing protein [Burkholderiaceae bacterium]
MLAAGARALAAAVLTLAAGAARADVESLRYCDAGPALSVTQQDRLLRFAAVVRGELEAAGVSMALVSRSGLNLRRFDQRYSHAGFSLRASGNAPWSVRQLYYACDEQRPKLFDQGLAGFVFGGDDPDSGFVSIVLLPAEAAQAVERAALDNARALRLLAATYSANAFAWSVRYQNCNQWVAELLAAGWGALSDGDDLRLRAQAWLREAGYVPEAIAVKSHVLMFAGAFVPWLRYDDHPEEDRYALRFRTSLPVSIEAFVHARVPAARRIELCHRAGRVVVREGWSTLPDDCSAEPADRVIVLD